jgi:multiple sugar transport system substrate-binding protein
MKRIWILCIIMVLSCQRSEKNVVTFWHVMSGPLGSQLNEMIAEFNSIHPEGKVKSINMGSYDALVQKLMGAVAAKTPPVISQMYESWTDQFYEAGFLEPLGNFVEQDSGFHLEDFWPVFIEDNTYGSVLVTLPFNKSVPVFYYNDDILRSIGVDTFPKNWDKFRSASERIHTMGIWATSWPIDVWYFSAMLYQAGGILYDETDHRPRFNDEYGVEVLTYIVDLVKDSLLYLNPGFQRQVEFLSERVAMIPASIASWAFIKDRPRFVMKVAPFPQGREPATVIAGTNIGMFANASPEQKRLAWEFIKWFLEPENQMRWTEASYYLPTRRSALRLTAFRKFSQENPGYEAIVAQLAVARTEPKSKEWFTGRIYLNESMEEAVRLERTPEDALDYAAQRLLVDLQ